MSNKAAGDGAGGSLVQSVDRAISVLEILARQGEAGVTEIAQQLGVHKSTAFRLVGVLAGRDLVEQPGERGKYRLGIGIIRLAGATAARLDLTRQSQPVCDEVAAEVGETANIAIAKDGVAVNIYQAQGSATVTAHNWVGKRTPLHATSSGKVLLAHLRADERDRVIAAGLARHTPNTITSAAALATELDAIRTRGYGTSAEELELGLNAVAAPVRSYDGGVIAAVSVSGPASRLSVERVPEVARTVVAAAAEISRQMGYLGD
jgi:IclR family acetate operon transcriptional repressor